MKDASLCLRGCVSCTDIHELVCAECLNCVVLQKSEEAFQQRVKDHLVKALKAPRPSQSAASIWNADSQRDAEIFRR